ncbi:MAG: DUF4097 family beta strand repeat protein [Anaerolineae bacterium]|nr:DUF4097 family beta strand repeat protein [Anaerolineae bacterium]
MTTDNYDLEPDLEKPKRDSSFDADFEKPKRGVDEYESLGTPMPPTPRRRGSRWPLYVLLGCVLSCMMCCIGPICALGIAGATLAEVLDNAKVTTTYTETVELDNNVIVTVTVDNRVGDVMIRRGNDDEVVVKYTKTAYALTESRAKKELDNIHVNITQPGDDTVDITIDLDHDNDNFFSLANNVDLTISVPETVYLDIENNVGRVKIEDIRARGLDIKNNTGDVRFDGELAFGSDYQITVNTGSVEVRLPDDSFLAINAVVDVGEVRVLDGFDNVDRDDAERDTVGETWHGTIGTGAEDPPTLKLEVNVGSINVEPN